MKAKNLFKSALALTCGAMVIASCSKTDDFGTTSLEQLQEDVYSSAFIKEFGQPAANHDWGFTDFSMVPVRIPEGSPRMANDNASARRRAVATSVTGVSPKKYAKAEDFLKLDKATAYFFLRIDNNIVVQEMHGVQSNPAVEYYPKPDLPLSETLKDKQYQQDNQGSINVAEYKKLNLITDGKGVTFATDNDPIPDAVFNAPSFETMAMHIPDDQKISIAGSVEEFNSENYKIFWYVAKWQASDQIIHVDGILVPKDQITINIPEYKARIIVEDLKGNIDATTTVSGSDFDFNDAVFDAVTWKRDGVNHLKIILRAAGGTLPITVNGVEIHEGVGYMFNTGKNRDFTFHKTIYEGIINEEAKTYNFNQIPVVVKVNGKDVVAGSNIGQAPEKVAVGVDYKWVLERTKITETYSKFADYVADKTVTNWWK